MTVQIAKLPETLINQIAAGEVVENPASCIKELIENSIDAKASHIDITIKSGGFLSILISDNGHGIPQDQILVAFERHTTSKLSQLEDLQSHYKMGFRGEALASIASCSKVIMKTSTEDGLGTCVEIHGGEVQKIESISMKKGTSIEIKDLFYNTPARKKFQKSASSSTFEIQKQLTCLMLAHPQVSFRFKSESNVILEAFSEPGSDFKKAFKKRLFDVFEDFDVDQGQFVNVSDPMISIMGYIAPFAVHSNTRKEQFFIVNNRPVDCPSIAYGLSETLKTFLPEKRFFKGVFHMNIDPKWIDINIHPQKKEIKFAEEAYVKDVFRRLVLPKSPISAIHELPPVNPVSFDYKIPCEPIKAQPSTTLSFDQFTYIKTIGFFSPYLLIDAQELDEFCHQEGLVLFDVKKAFASLKKEKFLENQQTMPSQGLLIPIPLKISSLELQNTSYLKQLGFELDSHGAMCAHPLDLSTQEALSICQDLIPLLKEGHHEEIKSYYFERAYQSKHVTFEEGLKLLSEFVKKGSLVKSGFFCLIKHTKLKEMFYACQSV